MPYITEPELESEDNIYDRYRQEELDGVGMHRGYGGEIITPTEQDREALREAMKNIVGLKRKRA